MHILFFNRSFYPDTASTGQLLTELCEDLVSEHNAQVTVIAGPVRGLSRESETLGLFASREPYHGIKILRTHSTSFLKTSFAGRACNYVTYFLCAFFAGWFGRRPDIIVSLTDPPIVGLAGWFRSRLFGASFVMLCQDIFPQVALLLEGFRKGLLYHLLDWISRFLLASADSVVAIGETMRARLISIKNIPAEKIHVIHNWADSSSIVLGPKENPFSRAHHIHDKFVVMHSGNVGLSQSLKTLMEAAILLQKEKDVVVAIVGDGAGKPELQRIAEHHKLTNVLFLPYQPKESLSESFAAADVFVVSLKKGMSGYIVPSKVYGILAAGRPFVGAVESDSEVTMIAEMYNCGLVARPEDSQDMTDKILQIYRNRQQGIAMGENGRKASLEYDRPNQVRKYFNLFEELLKKRSRGTKRERETEGN